MSARSKFRATQVLGRSDAKHEVGFALISALWFGALLSIVCITVLSVSLSTVNTVTQQRQAIVWKQLHDAALKSAVYDILRPRDRVITTGIPRRHYHYENSIASVEIEVDNEAAFLDLRRTPSTLLQQILTALQMDSTQISLLIQILSQHNSAYPNTTDIAKKFMVLDARFLSKLFQVATFYNGRAEINPLLASESLLRALPQMTESDATALITTRDQPNALFFSDSITHPLLSNRVSNFYRIRTRLVLGGERQILTRIVKLDLQSETLYKVVATL